MSDRSLPEKGIKYIQVYLFDKDDNDYYYEEVMETLRMTSQRRVILDALKSSKSHPSADMVYDFVRARIPNVSLGTVYRNLETMYRNKMIVKIETPDGQKRFDYNTEAHPHFHCDKCGKIEDIPMELEAPAPDPGSSWMQQRVITSSTLHYRGLCADCAGENLTSE